MRSIDGPGSIRSSLGARCGASVMVMNALASALITLVSAQSPTPLRPLRVEDRARFIEVGAPAISPDARWVLFSQTRSSMLDNRRHTTIWVARADSSAPAHQFLREGDRFLTWAPHSRSVFFFRRVTSSGADHEELFEQDVQDSVARQRSDLAVTDLGYDWQLSRDATFFLLVRADSIADAPGADLGAVFVDEGSNGQTLDYWSNLWRYDLGSRTLRRITQKDWTIQSAALSPDGQFAAVAARPDNGRNTAWKSELYLVALSGAEPRQLTHNGAPERNPQWFPDGRSILFEAVRLDRWDYGNGDLWRLDVASGVSNDLTPGHPGYFVQPTISPDGSSILVASGYGTARFPVRVDVADGRITPLLRTNGSASVGSWSADRRVYAYRYQDGTTPPDIYIGSVERDSARQRRISDVNPWIRTEALLGAVEVVRWKSANGLTIEGVLTRPVPDRARAPLIAHVPCGPGCGWKNDFSFRNQLFAGAGYAQLSVVVRGSSNYDDRFMHANRFDIGGGDGQNVLRGMDAMVARGVAHPDSLAIDGWSYGAVLGGYLLTQTTRFKAASLGGMVSEWIADYGVSANYDMVRWYIGGTPWTNPIKWRERSSLTHADRVRTPTLLHHGAEDEVDWPFHSMNYFAALRTAGTPARLIVYPGEAHDLMLPKSLELRDAQDLAWMQRYVRGIEEVLSP
jgi:dipeptidyl aminopeptidase/acylaminoacyl peptidase